MTDKKKVLKTVVEFTYIDPDLVNQPGYEGKPIRIEFFKGECKVDEELARINSMGREEFVVRYDKCSSEEQGQKYLRAARDLIIQSQIEKEAEKNEKNKKSSIKDNIMKIFKPNKTKNVPEPKFRIFQCYEERKI